MKNQSSQQREHAVVIGGSMAGLLASRVLADYYQRVTLVERDSFPAPGENRRGVPQGRHTHGLLASGRRVLDRLFPGLTGELIQHGAVPGDIVRDLTWFIEGGCHVRVPSGLDGVLMSRPFLEGAVRTRVFRIPNLRVRDNCEVAGLIATEDARRVTGVNLAGEELAADLVVDTTGRGSHSPQWLEKLGYARPMEERVEIALAYTTRFFRRNPADAGGPAGVLMPPTPRGKRGGVMLAQEGNRWTVTLTSHFCQAAPGDLAGFIEFARNLPAPYIHDVISNAEPLGDPASARFAANLRRRYEMLDRFPEGYLVFGDAISSFNPIYGQGMSVAAMESEQMAASLAEGDADLAKRFFRRAAKVIDIPWSIAAGNDLRMPETTGPRNTSLKLINWYVGKLHKAAHSDAVAALAFHQVANLLAAPPSLMHPKVAARVLWRNIVPRAKPHEGERQLSVAASN